jgi:Flp pilus assembly protein CpaB
MHRSPRVLIAWATAIVVGLLTTRLVLGDLATLHRRAQRLGRDVNVLVATRDLAIGHVIVASDLRPVARPSSLVTSDALRELNDAIGRSPTTAVLAGDVLRARHFAPSVVPQGQRMMHIIVKDGFRPDPGAIVDVLASFDASPQDRRALTVARDAVVVGGDQDPASPGITVLVREEETATVAFAQANGIVTVAVVAARSSCCSSAARG